MAEEEFIEGEYLYSTACVKCSSSDAMAVYEKEDEDGNVFRDAFCYSCCNFIPPSKLEDTDQIEEYVPKEEYVTEKSELTVQEVSEFGTSGSRKRKIRKEFMDMYGVKMSFKDNGAVDFHYYPVTKNSELTGYKPRELPKNFKVKQVGDTKQKDADLFGQWMYETGKVQVNKKFLLITEGELDAVALQQIMHDHGNSNFTNAVVSINSGAGTASKSIQTNWNWINKFENVILFFDQDEAGKKAAVECAKKLPLGKVRIAKLSEKDVCDMLKQDKEEEVYNAFWKAETYAPDGVVAGSGLWNMVTTPLAESDAHYPWHGLDNLLHGIRTSELITFTGGSGVAKSSMARMIAHHLQKKTEDNIGMLFLEESVKKTALQIMSLEVGKQLHLPETEWDESEMKDAFESTLGTNQYYFFDEFASQDVDAICESILYMVKAANCKYLFLDHISMMVSGGESGDERKALDAICTRLRSMVQQLDISLFIVTHLKRPPGVGHEEGAQTSLSQLRGTAGIAQLSDIVIGFERNSQAEDDKERNTTHVRVLKNRFSGETGLACSLLFDHSTGWVRELSEDEVEDMETDDSEFDGDEDFLSGTESTEF